MTTIPSRLAQRTIVSANFAEAQARSRALYRDWYRAAPEISSLYALNVPPSTLRAKFRTWFERDRGLKDVAVIDIMLFKSRAELQETLNAWKQIPHIMKWFQDEEVSEESLRDCGRRRMLTGRLHFVMLCVTGRT